MSNTIERKSPIIIGEVDLKSGKSILLWDNIQIKLPSDYLTLDEAVELVGQLQKAVEKLRRYENGEPELCSRCKGTNRIWDNGDMTNCHE